MISSALTKRGPIQNNHRKPHSCSKPDRTCVRPIETFESCAPGGLLDSSNAGAVPPWVAKSVYELLVFVYSAW